LLLSVFVLHDSLSVCYSFILILYFVHDFNNNNKLPKHLVWMYVNGNCADKLLQTKVGVGTA